MNDEYLPYTYLIGWSKLDKWYYGCEYSRRRIANPKNLWVTYFTSSKEIAIQIEYCGEPDIIQVRRTFETGEKARQWEHKALSRLNVVFSKRWLNKTDSKVCDRTGIAWRDKQKLNPRLKQYHFTKEHALQINSNPDIIAKRALSNTGKKRSLETRKKISDAKKQYYLNKKGIKFGNSHIG
jgi:hypothetical protein